MTVTVYESDSRLNWINAGWATATPYVVHDALKHGSPASSYRCILAHTSAATSEPGVGATWTTYWTPVAEAGSSGIAATLLDAKGDVIAATAADTPARLAVGANDTVLTADSAQATGLKWAAASAASAAGVALQLQQVGAARDRWYCASHGGNIALSTASGGMYNDLLAVPILSLRAGTLDRIAFEVTGAGVAGAEGLIGLYDSVSAIDLYPNARLESGLHAVDSTGIKATTIARALTAGSLYWLVLQLELGGTIRTLPNADSYAILGMPNTLGAALQGVAWRVARAWDGTLPATFPAGASVRDAAGGAPALFYRWSA